MHIRDLTFHWFRLKKGQKRLLKERELGKIGGGEVELKRKEAEYGRWKAALQDRSVCPQGYIKVCVLSLGFSKGTQTE